MHIVAADSKFDRKDICIFLQMKKPANVYSTGAMLHLQLNCFRPKQFRNFTVFAAIALSPVTITGCTNQRAQTVPELIRKFKLCPTFAPLLSPSMGVQRPNDTIRTRWRWSSESFRHTKKFMELPLI